MRRANNTDLTEVMFEVSMDNTLKALRKGHIGTVINRLIGSKTGKHKVKTLTGKAKREYYAIPEKDRLTFRDIEQGHRNGHERRLGVPLSKRAGLPAGDHPAAGRCILHRRHSGTRRRQD